MERTASTQQWWSRFPSRGATVGHFNHAVPSNNVGFGPVHGGFAPQGPAVGGGVIQGGQHFQDGFKPNYGQENVAGRNFSPGYGPRRGGPRNRGSRGGRDRGRGRQPAGRGQPGSIGGNNNVLQNKMLNTVGGRVEEDHAHMQMPINSKLQVSNNNALQRTVVTDKQIGKQVLTQLADANLMQPPMVPAKALVTGGAGTSKSKEIKADGQPSKGGNDGSEEKKQNDKDNWCFRCCSKGHTKEVCTTEIFCIICESEEHVAAKCPVRKRPRPMARAVGYAVDDLGFYHIPHAPYSTSSKDGKTALIKVVGGQLNEEELRGHLKRLVSNKFEWHIQLHGPNAWITPFPSKADLRRTVNFGSTDLKNGMSLKFEEFEEVENFGTEIPMVWMRVTNLPTVLRSYEVIWAVGTMFGATQRVDMITTRRNTFGRFKVVVLNPNMLPNKMDCVIGTRFFELQFEVEEEQLATDVPMITHGEDDTEDREGNRDRDEANNEGNKKVRMLDPSYSKNAELGQSDVPAGEGMVEDLDYDDMDEDDLLDNVAPVEDWTSDPLSVTGISRVNAMSLKVTVPATVNEPMSSGGQVALMTRPGECVTMSGREQGAEQVPAEIGKVSAPSAEQEEDDPFALGPFLKRTLMELKGKKAKRIEEVRGNVLASGVAKAITKTAPPQAATQMPTPLHRSMRRQDTVDGDSLEMAERLVAKKNLEEEKGDL